LDEISPRDVWAGVFDGGEELESNVKSVVGTVA
jgi:hypothetical protein